MLVTGSTRATFCLPMGLVCVACGRESQHASGWRGDYRVDENTDNPTFAFYCPECWERAIRDDSDQPNRRAADVGDVSDELREEIAELRRLIARDRGRLEDDPELRALRRTLHAREELLERLERPGRDAP